MIGNQLATKGLIGMMIIWAVSEGCDDMAVFVSVINIVDYDW